MEGERTYKFHDAFRKKLLMLKKLGIKKYEKSKLKNNDELVVK